MLLNSKAIALLATAAFGVKLNDCPGAGDNNSLCCPGLAGEPDLGFGVLLTTGSAASELQSTATQLVDDVIEFNDLLLCTGSQSLCFHDCNEPEGCLIHCKDLEGHFGALIVGADDVCTEQKVCGADTHKVKTCQVTKVREV